MPEWLIFALALLCALLLLRIFLRFIYDDVHASKDEMVAVMSQTNWMTGLEISEAVTRGRGRDPHGMRRVAANYIELADMEDNGEVERRRRETENRVLKGALYHPWEYKLVKHKPA